MYKLSNIRHFLQKKETLFIIHGWMNNVNSDVNSKIKDSVLHNHDVNVFVVDWSKISKKDYVSAQGSVKQVGGFVAEFVRALKSFGLNVNQLKFVGHSLGAHISGCAGAALGGQVERIVGLDPAGPLFGNNKDNRIDASDAKFVQIIHTNGGKLGFDKECGHSDYYPNGGKGQPGCGVDATGSCAHSRSYLYYAESLTSNRFVSKHCSSYSEYTSGKCKGGISDMGMYFVDIRARGNYYLETNSKAPWAKG